MADLPPIPDEACRAVYAANISTDYGMVGSDEARTIIAPAWPHLYAAAMRHAAAEWDRQIAGGGAPAGYWLRRLADSAAP